MSETLTLELDDFQDEYWRRGWTDGLPVVAPTEPLVRAMLEAGGLEPDELLGAVPARGKVVSAHTAAVNAVMAGCLPEYFPVVLAATGAALDPAMNIHSISSSTGGSALCVIVSGPVTKQIEMNATRNVLGGGNRANSTIGRALRLMLVNALGSRVGEMDGSVLGTPAKFSLCLAEDDPPAPWTPLRVDLGYAVTDSTVTVASTEAPRVVSNHLARSGEEVARSLVTAIRNPATFSTGKSAQAIIVVGPQHADILRADGWTKDDLRAFLVENTRITLDELAEAGLRADTAASGVQVPQVPGVDGRLATIRSAADAHILTAGGTGAGVSAYFSTWPTVHTVAVTRPVHAPDSSPLTCTDDVCAVPSFLLEEK